MTSRNLLPEAVIAVPHEVAELRSKALGAKAKCVLPARHRVYAVTLTLEGRHRLLHRRDGLFWKEDAGGARVIEPQDGLQGASLTERDDRCSAGLRLERRYAEILLRGKDKRASAPHMVQQHRFGLTSQQADVSCCLIPDPISSGSVADDNQ